MLETIGRYRIVASLGQGRLGDVYQAFDPEQQRTVALRVIRLPTPDDLSRGERFVALQGAARAAAMLDHRNIAAMYDHGEAEIAAEVGSAKGESRVFYVASALVEGESLASRLSGGTAIEPGAACRWLTQILLALDHAHARGVVHADLKPANVLITAVDEARVTDFGLHCGIVPGTGKGDSKLDSPAYLAPEQLLGDPVDARSDLFTAGILLYQMLTGRQPFPGGAAAVIEQILSRDPPPPSQLTPGLGTAFDGVISKALARQSDRRFASAGEFLMALNRAIADRAASPADDATAVGPDAAFKPIGALPVSPIEGWKVEAAAPLEAALADAVGPIARVLVRNALADAASFDAACAELAAHVPEPTARRDFNAAAKQSRPSRLVHEIFREAESRAAPQPAGDARPSPSGLIDPATLQMAVASLSDAVGPMARIIVQRTAAEAESRADFFRRLAAWIPTRQQHEFLRLFGVGE